MGPYSQKGLLQRYRCGRFFETKYPKQFSQSVVFWSSRVRGLQAPSPPIPANLGENGRPATCEPMEKNHHWPLPRLLRWSPDVGYKMCICQTGFSLFSDDCGLLRSNFKLQKGDGSDYLTNSLQELLAIWRMEGKSQEKSFSLLKIQKTVEKKVKKKTHWEHLQHHIRATVGASRLLSLALLTGKTHAFRAAKKKKNIEYHSGWKGLCWTFDQTKGHPGPEFKGISRSHILSRVESWIVGKKKKKKKLNRSCQFQKFRTKIHMNAKKKFSLIFLQIFQAFQFAMSRFQSSVSPLLMPWPLPDRLPPSEVPVCVEPLVMASSWSFQLQVAVGSPKREIQAPKKCPNILHYNIFPVYDVQRHTAVCWESSFRLWRASVKTMSPAAVCTNLLGQYVACKHSSF